MLVYIYEYLWAYNSYLFIYYVTKYYIFVSRKYKKMTEETVFNSYMTRFLEK